MEKGNTGKMIIFSAPSGAGKTTIVKRLIDEFPELKFSISATSRPKRPGEVDGRDYYFVTSGQFKEMIEKGEFIEWEEVYKDTFYGTLKSEVERIWAEGNSVIFDVDVIGGLNIKRMYGDKALAIFVMPPSIEELERRLVNRSTESEAGLKKRIDKARYELSFANKFDKIVVNDDLETAVNEAKKIVREFLQK